jgi:hypothetical protein
MTARDDLIARRCGLGGEIRGYWPGEEGPK